MFCFQCEQTRRTEAGAGCTGPKGVCGKDEVTADLQDLLIYQLKGIGQYRTRLGALGRPDREADSIVLFDLFATLTNVNFDHNRFVALIGEAAKVRDRLRTSYEAACLAAGKTPEVLNGPASFVPADTLPGLLAQASAHGVRAGIDKVGADVIGLRGLLLFGLKGVGAYAHHAQVLGVERDPIADGIAHTLDFLAGDPTDLNVMLEEAVALGHCNFTTMEALDAANTGTFGDTDAGAGTHHADRRQSDPGLRPRFARSRRDPGSHQGHRHQRLHPWRTAAGARLSKAARPSPPRRQFRRRLAKSAQRLRGLPWPDCHDVELYDRAAANLSQPHVHYRSGRLAGPAPYRNGDFSLVVKAAHALPGFAASEPERTITAGFGHQPCSASPTKWSRP